MKNSVRILSLVLIISILAACTPAPTTAPIAEPTATPVVYRVNDSADSYTPAQEMLNNAESTIAQKTRFERWLDYWVHANNRPFNLENTELKWKYIYDDPDNPTQVFLMLEAGGEYNGRLFTVPIGADGKFAEFPPKVSGDNIELGFGPLELSAGGEGMWLSVENGIPVRRDGTGTVVQTLNMETRQWEVVDINAERERIIVNRINEFLSSSGVYSDEKLADIIFQMGSYKYLEGVSSYEDDLGLLTASEDVSVVEGINLGSIEGENCVWMFLGTKMGEDGQRMVIPIKIPLEAIEYRLPIIIDYYNQRDIFPAGGSPPRILENEHRTFTSIEEIRDYLNNNLIDKAILLTLLPQYYGGDTGVIVTNYVIEHGGSNEDAEVVVDLFQRMFLSHRNSFCSFHGSLPKMTENLTCGSGYSGTMLSSRISKLDPEYLNNPNNILITILESYLDKKQ